MPPKLAKRLKKSFVRAVKSVPDLGRKHHLLPAPVNPASTGEAPPRLPAVEAVATGVDETGTAAGLVPTARPKTAAADVGTAAMPPATYGTETAAVTETTTSAVAAAAAVEKPATAAAAGAAAVEQAAIVGVAEAAAVDEPGTAAVAEAAVMDELGTAAVAEAAAVYEPGTTAEAAAVEEAATATDLLEAAGKEEAAATVVETAAKEEALGTHDKTAAEEEKGPAAVSAESVYSPTSPSSPSLLTSLVSKKRKQPLAPSSPGSDADEPSGGNLTGKGEGAGDSDDDETDSDTAMMNYAARFLWQMQDFEIHTRQMRQNAVIVKPTLAVSYGHSHLELPVGTRVVMKHYDASRGLQGSLIVDQTVMGTVEKNWYRNQRSKDRLDIVHQTGRCRGSSQSTSSRTGQIDVTAVLYAGGPKL
ncbi:hypothetical protein HKX48_001571 [Thoreauomyces humboldtii]|nr:hypothetical protein HKX48_001571 [Thoreauomyces humboldtii]